MDYTAKIFPGKEIKDVLLKWAPELAGTVALSYILDDIESTLAINEREDPDRRNEVRIGEDRREDLL